MAPTRMSGLTTRTHTPVRSVDCSAPTGPVLAAVRRQLRDVVAAARRTLAKADWAEGRRGRD